MKRRSFLYLLFGALSLFFVNSSPTYAEQQDSKIPSTIPVNGLLASARLSSALMQHTGFSLGSALKNVKSTELHICAAKMRYGPTPDSKVAQLFCSNLKNNSRQLIKFWVNFTSPAYGHKAWKINLALSGDRHSNSDFISLLKKRFGPPHIVHEPLAFKWKIGSSHLTLREDQFGLQLELWDRSLHFVI